MSNIIKTKIRRGRTYPLGFSRQGDWMQFTSMFTEQQNVKLQFWEKGEKMDEITLNKDYRIGNLYSVQVPSTEKQVWYSYEVDGKPVLDPCAKKIYSGKKEDARILAGETAGFNWEEENRPEIPYKEMILYRLHVRGFTKHSSSNVKNKGTFEGLCEKIPYLKELGVNAVLLMPCYEFEDYTVISTGDPRFAKKKEETVKNFWGYGGTSWWYFVPKRAFCINKKNPETEFCHMVKTMHENNMEVLMEFSFHEDTNPFLMIDCLRYWVEEYHVDGFYFNDGVTPVELIAKDPVLADRKLISHYWDQERMFGKRKKLDLDNFRVVKEDVCDRRQFADYHHHFLVASRCFLKGDPGMTWEFASVFRKNSDRVAQINYIADNNGFTLADLVSYNQKHNEENGENGRDGTRENYSWNCGQEGRTKKRLIINLRERQMKNAMLMLFLSQGVPMLYAGDEFGNSQNGNNNAYCQDNKIGWVNWDQKQKNQVFAEFVKKLIMFRKRMSVFQNLHMLTGQDYLACGSPDISWHGTRAWYPDFTADSRLLGVLLNGRYATGEDNRSVYVVFNMNWEDASIGFPRPDKGQCWKLWIDTAKTEEFIQERQKRGERKEYYMKARSVAVFVSAPDTEKMKKEKLPVKRQKAAQKKTDKG